MPNLQWTNYRTNGVMRKVQNPSLSRLLGIQPTVCNLCLPGNILSCDCRSLSGRKTQLHSQLLQLLSSWAEMSYNYLARIYRERRWETKAGKQDWDCLLDINQGHARHHWPHSSILLSAVARDQLSFSVFDEVAPRKTTQSPHAPLG